jgi:hypothetical protein
MSASASRTDSSRGELFKAAIPRLRDRSPKIGHICLRFPRTKRLAPKALSQTSPPQDGFAAANLGHPRKSSGLKARFTSALNSMQEYHELFRRLSGNEGFHSVQSPSSRDANDQHPGRARG